jgi:alpha-mannosidase
MPAHPNLERIKKRMYELEKLRYVQQIPLENLKAKKLGSLATLEVQPNATVTEGKGEWLSLKKGDIWGEPDTLYWFNFDFTTPPVTSAQSLVLHIDLSVPSESWSINTIEGMLYLNGQPFHALDRYHREVILPADFTNTPHQRLEGDIRVWTGIAEPYHVIHSVELRVLDNSADRLYLLLKLGVDAFNNLASNSVAYANLLTALDYAVHLLDFREVERGEHFYASCRAACDYLEAKLSENRAVAAQSAENGFPNIQMIGHAHIDVAWLWQLRHTRLKAANTFSTSLYHLERYSHFTFLQSQPQLYEYVKQDHPILYERIKQKVASGQWEAEGAMWVEADTNLTGAESLVRQFLFGQRFFEQEFGRRSRVLWLPDVFGYSAALPQLIKASGADYFITTKISWNDTNRLPYDTFWWEGLDGTRVLTHFITAQNNVTWPYFTYNGEVHPTSLRSTWTNYQHKDLNSELLVAYGYGDGGGGSSREMIEAAAIFEKPMVVDGQIPTTQPGRIADYMVNLDKRVGTNPRLGVWQGELYLEFHRGTYTSQGAVKRGNRHSEVALHNAEWLAATAHLLAEQPYPQEELASAWKLVLTNQFHDILPGSSIGEVYADAKEHYAEVATVTGQIIQKASQSLQQKNEAGLIVFNPTSWTQTGLVETDLEIVQASELPYQELGDTNRALVLMEAVPPLGYLSCSLKSTSANPQSVNAPNELEAGANWLENRYYRLELNERGQIKRLWDKEVGREVLASGERGNVFQLFEDKPAEYDAWNIDANYEDKGWELDNLVSSTIAEKGPLRAGLRLEWDYEGRTRVVQYLYLYAHSRRIDFVTQVDWQERQTLFKTAFGVNVRSREATADIQWGNVTRPTHRNTSWEQAKFELCAHKWFDLSEGDYGVAILNDCKYGYDVHNSTLRLTLLRGTIYPDPNADSGRHDFIYSLYPHQGGWWEGGVVQAAYALNYPLFSVANDAISASVQAQSTAKSSLSLITSEQPNVVVETVKWAEEGNDGLVVRLYECANRRGRFTLKLGVRPSAVVAVNLLEEMLDEQDIELSTEGDTVSGYIKPYEIKTLLLRF